MYVDISYHFSIIESCDYDWFTFLLITIFPSFKTNARGIVDSFFMFI